MPPSKQNKRFKRPSGWRHITGYRKYIQPTARCGKCNEKCKIDNPFRKCLKCAFHICWNCEQDAGGPSHKSVECSIIDPLPADCSDTTDSEDVDSKKPVYRWADDNRLLAANQRSNNPHSVMKRYSHGEIYKSRSMVGQDMEDVIDDHGYRSYGEASSPKPIRSAARGDVENLLKMAARGKKSSPQLKHDIINYPKDKSVFSSTSDSNDPDVLGSDIGLTATERQLYMARKPLLEKLDLWVQPAYVPPGMVPGVVQRRLLNASPRELEDFAKVKREWFFHTLGRTALLGNYSYGGIAPVPAYPNPRASPRNWPVALSEGLTAVKDISVAYDADPKPRPLRRRARHVVVSSLEDSDIEIEENVAIRESAFNSSHRSRSEKRQGQDLSQSLFKRHKTDKYEETLTETVKPSPHVFLSDVAQQIPQSIQSTTSFASHAVRLNCDEDEGNVEVNQPRAFGRGRGRLDVATGTSTVENTEVQKPLEMHQPKPQKRASRILEGHRRGSDYLDWVTATEEPSAFSYQDPTIEPHSHSRGLAGRASKGNGMLH